MPSEQEKREFLKKVRAHGKTDGTKTVSKSNVNVGRRAMWAKAMKAAQSGPKVRVEGD